VETISQKIFLTYDIRGRYPKEINGDVLWRLGYNLPLILQKQKKLPHRRLKIVVGRDSRPSGAVLIKNLIQGLLQNNVEVVDAGVITAPMLYFLIKKHHFDLGFIITGSHLSENYTGLKIYTQELNAISGNWLLQFIDILNRPATVGLTKGKLARKNFLNDYSQFLLQKTQIEKKQKALQQKNILVCCPKASQLILEIVRKELKLNLQFVHRPIPKRLIRERKCDFVVQFDSDGDRMYVFNQKGEQILGDVIGAFFVELMKNKTPKKTIVDYRCGRFLINLARQYHFRIIYSPAGHGFFKQAMKKNEALLGIEKSGHYYWKDFFFADSGIFSFLMLLKFLASEKENIDELARQFMKGVVLPEINFKVKKQNQIGKIFQKIEKIFAKAKINKSDGLTVWSKDFKFNLRASQTEPGILRLNIEAINETVLQETLSTIKKIINNQ